MPSLKEQIQASRCKSCYHLGQFYVDKDKTVGSHFATVIAPNQKDSQLFLVSVKATRDIQDGCFFYSVFFF